jgi:hypothetical protein
METHKTKKIKSLNIDNKGIIELAVLFIMYMIF